MANTIAIMRAIVVVALLSSSSVALAGDTISDAFEDTFGHDKIPNAFEDTFGHNKIPNAFNSAFGGNSTRHKAKKPTPQNSPSTQ